MQERDIQNYDYLSVTLKKSSEEELLRCYSALGWEQTEVSEDKLYIDITHYELRRPHDIADKDKKQLLQVRVEAEVNRMAKIAAGRHIRSTAAGITIGVIAMFAIAAGVFLMVYFKSMLFYIIGGVLCAVGALMCGVCSFVVKRLAEWENGVCESQLRTCLARLKEIFSRIYKLTGVEDGRQ